MIITPSGVFLYGVVMNLRELVQGKEMTRKDELIEQLQIKVKSLQETIDLHLESYTLAQDAINGLFEDKKKLEMQIKRMKREEKASDDS